MMSRPALGSATHGPHIFDLRDLSGAPRFYPSGEHPATYRLRWLRRRLVDQFYLVPGEVCEQLEYVERQLAEFEAGEDEAKRREWFRLRDRLGLER